MSFLRTMQALTALGLGAALQTPAAAQTPAEFYKGKTVEILAGFPTGGGYDAYARALATAIGKYIPGNPTVVVRNMTGAGSLRLAIYLQDAAPKDGLSFGIFDNGLLIAPLLKPDTVKLNASKLTWIGTASKDIQVCSVWYKSDIQTLNDLKTKSATFGVTGVEDIRYMNTALLKHVAGANIKIVSGYPGSTDIRLAMETGEVDGVCDSWQSLKATKSEWLADKKIRILVQMAPQAHKELTDVPLIGSFSDPATQGAALTVLLSPTEVGRSFAAPPGIPADRAEVLRRAFDMSMKDPAFLDLTSKSRLEVDPMRGEEVEGYLRRVYASTPADVAKARQLVE
ncbi:MAG: family tricarboxylate transporter, receptor protein [Hyphomicrobiales bacterium]|nr:family tricarboxylate transporter, receptor protein [Hyphomicrobiales bacterium]